MPIQRRPAFERGLEVLEGALAIGRQADALALEDVRGRMDRVKSSMKAGQGTTSTPASSAGIHLVSKLKSWLGGKKPEPVG
jgi:hypothetical protein